MKYYFNEDKSMRLYNGDCLEVMDKLIEAGVRVDMVLTDPPYGTTACKWDSVIPFEDMWKRLKLLRNDSTPIALFGSEPFSSMLRMSNIKEYKYDWVWVKNKPSGALLSKKQPMRANENIHVFYSAQPNYIPIMVARSEAELKKLSKKSVYTTSTDIDNRTYGKSLNRDENMMKYPTNVLNIKTVFNRSKEKVEHPTQKPVELMEYLIKTYTNEGDLVLDFTMGSGSTGVACKNTNRRFIGIELDEKYFDIAVERIKD